MHPYILTQMQEQKARDFHAQAEQSRLVKLAKSAQHPSSNGLSLAMKQVVSLLKRRKSKEKRQVVYASKKLQTQEIAR